MITEIKDYKTINNVKFKSIGFGLYKIYKDNDNYVTVQGIIKTLDTIVDISNKPLDFNKHIKKDFRGKFTIVE